MQGGLEISHDFEMGIFGAVSWQHYPTSYHVVASILEFSLPWRVDICVTASLLLSHLFEQSLQGLLRVSHRLSQRGIQSRNTIVMWISKFRKKGSVLDTKLPGRHRYVRTEENTAPVLKTSTQSIRSSVTKHVVPLNLSRRGVSRFLNFSISIKFI